MVIPMANLSTNINGERSNVNATSVGASEAAAAGNPSVDLERQPSRAEVAAQTEALLTRTLGEGNVPRNRITFRGGRAKLSNMQGKGSTMFYMLIFSNMFQIFEASLVIFTLSQVTEDYFPSWVNLVLFISLMAFIPLVFFDWAVGSLVVLLSNCISGKETHSLSGTRDWIAFRSISVIFVFYIFFYDEEGTSKPLWLDWLG